MAASLTAVITNMHRVITKPGFKMKSERTTAPTLKQGFRALQDRKGINLKCSASQEV